jgi:AAHS family 4-hydroxybenzoate transporter-like MFS transporter
VGELIDERPLSSLQKRVVALCALMVFLDGYDVQALGLAIPRMAAHFGVAPTAFAPSISGTLIGMALGAALLSSLADRFGRRRTSIALLWWVVLTMVGATLSVGPWSMAAWRLLSGLGLGALVPVAITLTSEYAPARRRASLITLMVSFTALGAFAAGLIAPVLEAWGGWRAIFGFGAAAPALAALVCLVALPESLRWRVARDPQHPDVQAQVDRIAGGPAPSVVAGPSGAAPAARTGPAALWSPSLRRRTLLLWVLFATNLFVNYGLISWLPTLLVQAGWEHAAAQRASGVLALAGIVGSLLVSYQADRGRMLPAMLGAYLLAALSLVLLGLAPASKAAWIALLAAAGMGAFGAQMAIGSLTAGYYPSTVRSTGVGWASGVGRIGSFVGPAVLAAFMGTGAGAPAIIGGLMLPMLICAVCVMRLPAAIRDQDPG